MFFVFNVNEIEDLCLVWISLERSNIISLSLSKLSDLRFVYLVNPINMLRFDWKPIYGSPILGNVCLKMDKSLFIKSERYFPWFQCWYADADARIYILFVMLLYVKENFLMSTCQNQEQHVILICLSFNTIQSICNRYG